MHLAKVEKEYGILYPEKYGEKLFNKKSKTKMN